MAPLLFLQVIYGNFIYVSTVLMAVFWLSLFVLIILSYYGVYLFNFKYDILGSWKPWIMGLVLIILLIVAMIFTNSLLLMIDPKSWVRYFQEPWGRIIHASEPSLIPRYLHFVLASLATGGLIWASGHGGKKDTPMFKIYVSSMYKPEAKRRGHLLK